MQQLYARWPYSIQGALYNPWFAQRNMFRSYLLCRFYFAMEYMGSF